LTLTQEAGERFLIATTRLTSQPTPGYLVIEFDGAVLSAPQVRAKISNKVAISCSRIDKLNHEKLVAAIRESIDVGRNEKETSKENESINAASALKTNARSVVEAYVASALVGDVAKAAALAKNAPADSKRIAEIPEFLNVQRLKIQTVYVNAPTKPTRALSTRVMRAVSSNNSK